MGRHGHDRAGAVLHQHVVGDPDGDRLAVDGIDHAAAGEDAGLLLLLGPLDLGQRGRAPHVVDDGRLVLGAAGQLDRQRMLGRQHEERRPEQRVRARGEHRQLDRGSCSTRKTTSAPSLRPIQLRCMVTTRSGQFTVSRSSSSRCGVVRDLEEPLLQVLRLDQAAAPLAVAVDHLLVGQHRLVDGAPLDGRLAAVGQPGLEQPQEDPLRPLVVLGLARRDLARPVDRPAHPLHLLADRRDVLPRGDGRVLAALDRRVLGRQAERVVAHRMHHAPAVAAADQRDDVAHRVVLDVPHVQLAGRVRQHLQHVHQPRLVLAGLRVGHLVDALVLPDGLPFGLDCCGVVSIHKLGSLEADAAGAAARARALLQLRRVTTEAQAAGVRWDLSPLFGSADDARAALATSLERATAFEQTWRGAMPEMTGPRLAEALLELGEIDNLLSRVHSYASLRKAVDVTNEENRDLSAAVEQGVVQVLNALRFFELEWLALEDDRAAELAAAPEVAADRHYLEALRRFRPHTLSEPEERVLAERDPAAVSAWQTLFGQTTSTIEVPFDGGDGEEPHTVDRLLAYVHDPRRDVRRRRAGDAVRGARPAHAGAGPMLRLAGRRPAGARPPALLRDADHPDAPAQRARCLGGRRDAGRGRGELPDRPAVVPSQGRRARARQARAARPVRPRGQRPRRRLRRGPHDRDDRVRRVRTARAAGGRRACSRSIGSTPSRGPASAAARSARRSQGTPIPTS